MLSSTCCSEPTCTWMVEETLWESHFFYFSSVFNTIQPLLLGEKLQGMGVHHSVISWVTDYLTGRPQFVHLGSVRAFSLSLYLVHH